MPTRRNQQGKWFYRKVVKLPDGGRVRISGTPTRNTKLAAEQAEREHVDRVIRDWHSPAVEKRKVPTFAEWFWGEDSSAAEPRGRFWIEWVIGQKNKPSEREAKRSIYLTHLQHALGALPLDAITTSEVAKLRASLVERKLSEKRINNIMTVVSKALRYGVDAQVIASAPRVGMFKIDRPEIEFWEYEEYTRILEVAAKRSASWLVAVSLCGEAGLRVGEMKALRWENVDLVARTITVSEQTRRGITGTPKGGRRRVVPINATLLAALKALDVVRIGFVARNLDGSAMRDEQATYAIWRICNDAGLMQRGWHSLRHSFGTHAALFGVNPWRLQAWLGHGRIDETMLYVHVASAHVRPLPPEIDAAAQLETDPDQKTLTMLAARRGISVAASSITQIVGKEKGAKSEGLSA